MRFSSRSFAFLWPAVSFRDRRSSTFFDRFAPKASSQRSSFFIPSRGWLPALPKRNLPVTSQERTISTNLLSLVGDYFVAQILTNCHRVRVCVQAMKFSSTVEYRERERERDVSVRSFYCAERYDWDIDRNASPMEPRVWKPGRKRK